jgi:hypothetical protein
VILVNHTHKTRIINIIMLLMKSQKNDVFELIQKSELDPFNFEWTTDSFRDESLAQYITVDKIVYKNSDYFFIFGFVGNEHYAFFSPGDTTMIQEAYTGTWMIQKQWFRNWLIYLKREIHSPDLWQELSRYELSKGDRISDETTNAPFTVYQAEQIIDGINKLRFHIEEQFSLNEYENKLVNDKLDYLIDAAKRQGRMDWIHTAIGVTFTLAASLNMSPDQANTIWSFIKNAVSGVIQFLTG